MSENIRLEYGQTITATRDLDGYPAVQIEPSRAFVTTQDDIQWVTASSHSHDAEDKVRDLAQALTLMADAIAAGRRADATAAA